MLEHPKIMGKINLCEKQLTKNKLSNIITQVHNYTDNTKEQNKVITSLSTNKSGQNKDQNQIIQKISNILDLALNNKLTKKQLNHRCLDLEVIPIHPPFYYTDWINEHFSHLWNGLSYEPNLTSYINFRKLKNTPKILPETQQANEERKKTLVLDLDETLVHSSFNASENAQIMIPINVESNPCNIYVQVRPGVSYFIEEASKIFEVVIYTASLSKYADPLMTKLDPSNFWSNRLFREHCTVCNNVFIKDLLFLGKNMKDVIIIDNSPNSYAFQNENAIPITSWYGDGVNNVTKEQANQGKLLFI